MAQMRRIPATSGRDTSATTTVASRESSAGPLSVPETSADTEAMTLRDREKLAQHEEAITRGLQTFLDVGSRLADIRDKRLYRDQDTTFEAYCERRWGFSDRRARQLIDAAGMVAALPTGTIVPVTESQARELSGLSPDDAAEVMRLAHRDTAGRVTAAAIAVARDTVTARCYPYREHPVTALLPWDQWVVDAIAEQLDRDRDPARPDQLKAGSVSANLSDGHAMVLSADGATIIDGRHRYAAYRKAGIEPRFRRWPHATSIWTAPDDDEEHILTFIVSVNLRRQHLTEDQRAVIAAKLAEGVAL